MYRLRKGPVDALHPLLQISSRMRTETKNKREGQKIKYNAIINIRINKLGKHAGE